MRSRRGYTVIELLVVILLAGVVAGATMPRVGRSLAQQRLQQAGSVVSADLRLAHSMAVRRSAPVRVEVDTAQRSVRVRNFSGTDTTFSVRRLGPETEFGVQRLSADATSVVVYPNGLSSSTITITLRAAGYVRRVRMSPAGQIRMIQ
jgi:prepilin-type N-terminal cleavage/methylation domain-containing protein